MSKSFACRELMGVCDEKFSGDTFMEVAQKGMQHMQSANDDTHKEQIASFANHTKEDGEKWFEEMQLVFDARPDDE